MSLINDMLKDLEARGGTDAERDNGVRAPIAADRSSARLLVLSLSALVVVLAAAVAYLGWFDTPPESLNQPVDASIEPPARNLAPSAIAATDLSNEAAPQPEAAAQVVDTAPVAAEVVEAATPIPVSANPPAIPVEQKAPPLKAAAVSAPETESEQPGTVVVRRHEPSPEQRAQRAAQEGTAALRRGDWTTAARLLQEVIEVEPANDDAREGLVIALQRQGRLSETDAVLLDGLAVATNPARFAKLRARLQASRNELDAALDTLAIAVPRIAADPEYHALKAALAQQAGRHSEAAEIYSALTEYAPGNGTWLAGLAIALDRQGEAAAARDAYIRALQAGGLDRALVAHAQRRLTALDEALGNE